MKNIKIFLVVLIIGLFAIPAHGQRGLKSVGAMGGIFLDGDTYQFEFPAGYLLIPGGGVTFEIQTANHISFEFSAQYYAGNITADREERKSEDDAPSYVDLIGGGVDMHYIFKNGRFKPYALVGLFVSNFTCLDLHLGLGADYRITPHFALGLQIKAGYHHNNSGGGQAALQAKYTFGL